MRHVTIQVSIGGILPGGNLLLKLGKTHATQIQIIGMQASMRNMGFPKRVDIMHNEEQQQKSNAVFTPS